MKKIPLILWLLFFAVTAVGQSPQSKRFGLGVVVGSPTALTGKYWDSLGSAFDFGISYSVNYFVLAYGDYAWHYPKFFGHKTKFISQLVPYLGIGAGIYNWAGGYYYKNRPYGWTYADGTLGIYGRAPIGIEWFPTRPTLGVFIEVAPGIAFIPGLGLTLDFGAGCRYYF